MYLLLQYIGWHKLRSLHIEVVFSWRNPCANFWFYWTKLWILL